LDISQSFILFELRAKQKEARRRNGVVGKMGRNIPRMLKKMKNMPQTSNIILVVFPIFYR